MRRRPLLAAKSIDQINTVPVLSYDGSSSAAAGGGATCSISPHACHTFTSRVDYLVSKLLHYKSFRWRFAIFVFSWIDISLALLSIAISAVTAVVCSIDPEIAKWLAAGNACVAGIIALLKGTGLPSSMITVDGSAKSLRYKVDDLKQSCSLWDLNEQGETAQEHEQHEQLFLKLQEEYLAVCEQVSILVTRAYSG